MTDTLDRRRSVTRDDFQQAASYGGVWEWTVLDPGSIASPTPQLPPIGSRARDALLTATLDLEDMWAAAANKAVTKIATRGYEISDQDDSTRKTEQGKTLIMNFDGQASYRQGLAKAVQDFLLTDNGYFVEVERVASTPGSRIRALWHLDSFRCWRTGNLDYPVVYQDDKGVWHKLRADQVLFGADMPSARRRRYNGGRCAASRAFQTIVKLSAVETYFREKITGSRALALHFISGTSTKQLTDAIALSEAEKARRGHVVYKGVVMVPLEGDTPINVATVELAGVPDGFDVEQERKDAYLRYANALGIPVQDIQPLSGQGLGTGTQTVILAEAEEGQGLAYFVKLFEDQLNYLVMPKTTVFAFKTNDIRDQKAKADVDQVRANTISSLLAAGAITAPMALQLLADDGIVPKEFLPKDVTPAGVLTDSGDQSKPNETVNPVAALALLQPPAPVVPLVKSFEDEWEAALAWAEQEVSGDAAE